MSECVVEREDPLFEKLVPVLVRYADREDRNIDLTVRVLLGTQGAQREQLLHVEVTDERDPFFLYGMDVTEAEFHALKQDQCLLVDFAVFPTKFIELLEKCLDEKTVDDSSTASFLAVLDTRPNPTISIVEKNLFKHLTHLSLNLRPGDDGAVKGFLAASLQQSKGTISRLEDQLSATQNELQVQSQNGRQVVAELEQLREQHNQMLNQTKLDMATAMAAKADKAATAVEALKEQHKNELMQQQQRSEAMISQLQNRLEECMEENHQLSQGNHDGQTSVKTLQTELNSKDKLMGDWEQELEGLRAKTAELESTVAAQDKELSSLTLQQAASDQQIRDKEDVISKMTSLLESAGDHKGRLEESLRVYKSNHGKMQNKLETSIQEINKGNQIIQQLQGELREAKSKLRWKGTVVKQQEQLLEERQHAVAEVKRKLAFAEDDIMSRDAAISTLQEKLSIASKEVEERDQLLHSNQQVIAFLNNEMNEKQLGEQPGFMSMGMRPMSNISNISEQPQAAKVSSPFSFRPSASASVLLQAK